MHFVPFDCFLLKKVHNQLNPFNCTIWKNLAQIRSNSWTKVNWEKLYNLSSLVEVLKMVKLTSSNKRHKLQNLAELLEVVKMLKLVWLLKPIKLSSTTQ